MKALFKKPLFLSIFLLVLILGSSFGGYAYYLQSTKQDFPEIQLSNPTVLSGQTNTTPSTTQEPQPSITNTIEPTTTTPPLPTQQPYTLEVYGWLPSFDFNNALASLNQNKQTITKAAYAGHSINQSGELVYATNWDKHLQTLNRRNETFGLNIGAFEAANANSLLSSSTKIRKLLDKILAMKKSYTNLNWVIFDFENIRVADQSKYIQFLRQAKKELSSKDIQISTAQFCLNTQQQAYKDFLNQILAEVDSTILMCYDYQDIPNKTKGYEQALSPDIWIEQTLNLIDSQNSNKIILGMPLYGYEYTTSGKQLRSYTYSQILSILEKEKLKPDCTTLPGDCIVKRKSSTIYFQNQQIIKNKKEIAKSHKLSGIAFWRFGGEGELIKN